MLTVYIVCLGLLGVLCVLGTFAQCFDDNLLQRLGMGFVGLSCALLAVRAIRNEHVDITTFAFVLGIALFALGMASKVWRFRRSTS